jgi:glycerol uptake facilitator-like aquaporin
MLPTLGQFIIGIIGASLLVGLITVFGEKRSKEGKSPLNPTGAIIVIVIIIMIFVGYLIS